MINRQPVRRSAGNGNPDPRHALRRILRAIVVSACASAAFFAAAPAAHAASAISACFSYQGQRYQGLATVLEYMGTDSAWYPLDNTVAQVESDGCVSYTINSGFESYQFRIRAVGIAAATRGLFSGTSQYYAPSGGETFDLGEGDLTFYPLPESWPTAPRTVSLQDDWLSHMTNGGGTSTCNTSAAAEVACYMDANGLVGNVIVQTPDMDDDDVPDDLDHFPGDTHRT
jgi:hypothetical protein